MVGCYDKCILETFNQYSLDWKSPITRTILKVNMPILPLRILNCPRLRAVDCDLKGRD